jgi:hypothetical protein
MTAKVSAPAKRSVFSKTPPKSRTSAAHEPESLRAGLIEMWHEAESIAVDAEALIDAKHNAYSNGMGPLPTPIQIEVVRALRETADSRRAAALRPLKLRRKPAPH